MPSERQSHLRGHRLGDGQVRGENRRRGNAAGTARGPGNQQALCSANPAGVREGLLPLPADQQEALCRAVLDEGGEI